MRNLLPTARLCLPLVLLAIVPRIFAEPVDADFHYADLDSFAQAIAEIDAGRDANDALRDYLDRASPALKAFAATYGTTAEKIAQQLQKHPKYYRALTRIRPKLESLRPVIAADLRRLAELVPGAQCAVHFVVAQGVAGATPRQITRPDGTTGIVIVVAVDLLGTDAETDMAEFPTPLPVTLADLPQVIVHEMVHVLQIRAQGGLANYRSIYTDPARGTLLAFAIREGAAEFVTFLATGRRLGQRHVYGLAREAELWAAFSPVMLEPQGKHPEWFSGGKSTRFPDLPMQTGYFIGMQICQAFLDSASDKPGALERLMRAGTAEDFAVIVAPYAARLGTVAGR